MHGDGLLLVEALMEVLALEHLRDGVLGGELDEIGGGELVEPLVVEADLGLVRVEDLEHLRLVGLSVLVDLVEREGGARGAAAAGVADEAGEAADEKDDR